MPVTALQTVIEEEFEGETIVNAMKTIKIHADIVDNSDHGVEEALASRSMKVNEDALSKVEDDRLEQRVILENMEMIHTNLTAEGAIFNTHEPHGDIKVLEGLKKSTTTRMRKLE